MILADHPQNYFFFSAGFFSAGFFVGGLFCRRGRALLGAFGGGFFAGFGALFALGRRLLFALFAFFLLFLDHLDIARGHHFGGCRRHLFLFRARHRHGHDRHAFVAENLNPGRRLDFAEVNGLAEFEMADINHNLLRQILGQGPDFELEQNVFENAAASSSRRRLHQRFPAAPGQ